jgi:tetratricopeptide (TPR) repeat protein
LEHLSIKISKVENIKNLREKFALILTIVEDARIFAKDLAESKEFEEAGEFLCSVAEIIEELNSSQAYKLYKLSIDFWEQQINSYKLQAKFHEIAEIYKRLADLYSEKFKNKKLEKKYILNAISYMRQESKLLKEFNEIRKLLQNYQNIAELYLRISYYKKAMRYFSLVIDIAKEYLFFDLLSYSYQQVAKYYQDLGDIKKANDLISDGIEFFNEIYEKYDKKNDHLALSQIFHVLKNLYKLIDDEDQFINFSKKEAGSYINLAERIIKNEDNYQKIAGYYRGAALCYQEINNNLIESASCFILAGNYTEKIEDFNEAGANFYNAAVTFRELNNNELSYKHFVKAGDCYWKIGNVNDSTESYLNAYDIAVEANLEYNRFGIFNQIIRGLNIIAKEGLKSKQFFTAATLILESIKFYQQLDTAKDFLVNEMVKNVYKYYYRAANLKKIGYSHIVQSYILAAISSVLNGRIKKAQKILSEIEVKGNTAKRYVELVEMIIERILEGKSVDFNSLPYHIQRIVNGSEEISYLLHLFKGYKVKV